MLESLKKSAINLLISQDDQAQFYEYKYFIGQFNPKNDQDKEFVIKIQQRYFTYQCAGLCFAAYIMFAYRRMLSGGVLSPLTKITVDLTLLSASLFLSSKIGVTSVMRDLVPLRKKLLNEPDVDYLRHLLSKYKKFDFYKENEFTLYHDVLTTSEFKEWKELHKFDVTKF